MKNIVILGATGSIGQQTLSVIQRHPQKFRVYGLVAHQQSERMVQLCLAHQPVFAMMTDHRAAQELSQRLGQENSQTVVQAGMEAVLQRLSDPEIDGVMCAMVGAVGIASAYQAILQHKTVYLANKESMVVAGRLFNAALQESSATLLPIDSEHNALFQCLSSHHSSKPSYQGVRNLWLTASGGPFRGKKQTDLHDISPDVACDHPQWKMGPKISVDSATLMNKGLEIIEAHFLFNMPADQIQVVIHPQSIVHSMVEYRDGSFLAQLSSPDMRTPIAYALGYPDRIEAPVLSMSPMQWKTLTFEEPDRKTFRCLDLAYQALQQGGNAALVLNASNEIAVAAFLARRCRFTDIAHMNETLLCRYAKTTVANSVSELIEEDQRIRALATEVLEREY